jgi:hypothetical protein
VNFSHIPKFEIVGYDTRDWICPGMVTQINPAKRLSHCEESVDWTCVVQETDTSYFANWNPAMDPDKSVGLRNSEWREHVWAGGRHV